jgi:hypothetical protein
VIAALYVDREGPYADLRGVDVWCEARDARRYHGPYPVVAHPPCERWGRYWSGGPNPAAERRAKGDDGGCFAHALACVRAYGGVLEHPEASHAWAHFGLARPDGPDWIRADAFGYTACVAQGHYGHPAQKKTWLYAVGCTLPALARGPFKGTRIDTGFASKAAARAARDAPGYVPIKRLSLKERLHTPTAFRDMLIFMALSAHGKIKK